MIVYKIDKQPHIQTNTQIRDMARILEEITSTYEILQDLVTKQGSTISSPSINEFRNELQQDTYEAMRLSRKISENSQKLVNVSDQAGKHLTAIEEHFGATLRQKQPVNNEVARV